MPDSQSGAGRNDWLPGSPLLPEGQRTTNVHPPGMVLLCLDPNCHGEFYLPLERGEACVCPNDREHPVAVYELLHGI